MNNGHGPAGAQVDQLLQQAAAQQQAQQQLQMVLQAAMQNPAEIHRFTVSMTAVAREGENRVLLVALPTGTRLEIPLNSAGAVRVARQLMAADTSDIHVGE